MYIYGYVEISFTRSVFSGFVDIFTICERVEQGLKSGKIPNVVGASSGVKKFSKNFQKKKEGETNVVSIGGGRSRRGKPQPPLVY